MTNTFNTVSFAYANKKSAQARVRKEALKGNEFIIIEKNGEFVATPVVFTPAPAPVVEIVEVAPVVEVAAAVEVEDEIDMTIPPFAFVGIPAITAQDKAAELIEVPAVKIAKDPSDPKSAPLNWVRKAMDKLADLGATKDNLSIVPTAKQFAIQIDGKTAMRLAQADWAAKLVAAYKQETVELTA